MFKAWSWMPEGLKHLSHRLKTDLKCDENFVYNRNAVLTVNMLKSLRAKCFQNVKKFSSVFGIQIVDRVYLLIKWIFWCLIRPIMKLTSKFSQSNNIQLVRVNKYRQQTGIKLDVMNSKTYSCSSVGSWKMYAASSFQRFHEISKQNLFAHNNKWRNNMNNAFTTCDSTISMRKQNHQIHLGFF